MHLLWKKPDQTVSDMLAALNAQPLHKTLAYTTVLTITRRLQHKEVITSRKRGRSFVFRAKSNQQDFIKSLVHRTVTSFAQHFGEQAVAAFIAEAASLSPADRNRALRALKKIPVKQTSARHRAEK